MKTEQVVTVLAGAVLAFIALQIYRKRKPATGGTVAERAGYEGTWTSAGPLDLDTYYKQIWD